MSKLFPISIEVEQDAVGRVMLLLNKTPGVAKFHLDMDRAVKPNGHAEPRGPYKTRAPRKPAVHLEDTGEQTVLKTLFGKPPMTTQQLRDVFVSQGRSASSISSVLHAMLKKGELQNGEQGYSLTKKSRDRMYHKKVAAKKGRR